LIRHLLLFSAGKAGKTAQICGFILFSGKKSQFSFAIRPNIRAARAKKLVDLCSWFVD
jgi:hypothetical protein